MYKKRIIELLDERATIDDNNVGSLNKVWENLVSQFTDNDDENEIIEFLDSLNDEQLEYASEVFEEINDRLGNSKSFVEKLDTLKKKHPNASLGI